MLARETIVDGGFVVGSRESCGTGSDDVEAGAGIFVALSESFGVVAFCELNVLARADAELIVVACAIISIHANY